MSNPQTTNDLQPLREKYISILDSSINPTQKARELADTLFVLDLTMYSSIFTFDSIIYSSMAKSILDENISLHPEQIQIINQIQKNEALIVSAPTSFGKTFCIFEYIARYKPSNVVLIVPTLALVDEYLKRIIKKYPSFFSQYKIHTNINEENQIDFNQKNIFILTHDRVIQDSTYSVIHKIDFLVIDEVYKLKTDPRDDRVLVLNMAYYYLAKKANKYVLLAPFINSIEDIEMLEKKPVFYNTEYSPVVNRVIKTDILRHKDRYPECQRIITTFDPKDKVLIYFPTVAGIYKYIKEFIANEPCLNELDESVNNFLSWAREEIHEDWCLIKAIERGYLIHNGQIPMGIRMFQLDFFESSSTFNRLLCTSTLLEGVNTTAKNIVITKPSRISDKNDNKDNFSAFDFFNLVGRAGRLNQYFVGNAFYIKGPNDPDYKKIDAIKSIKFEITDDSKDVDIQKGNVDNHSDVLEFLSELGISIDEYHRHIGSRLRFETVKAIYVRFKEKNSELLGELKKFIDEHPHGRLDLVKILYEIIEGKKDPLKSNIINNLLNKQRLKIKTVVDKIPKNYKKNNNLDYIISTIINIKCNYIEHQFYSKVLLIRYFLEKLCPDQIYLDILDTKILDAIELLYFTNSKQKKMLIDLGIYERDVELIIKTIGEDFNDAFELKHKLQLTWDKLQKQKISFISRYVIQSLL